jgi:endonuclease YncB( thermonuclease family)
MIGKNFEINAANDPDSREYMLRFSDPKFFSHTQKLRKVWGLAKVVDGQTLVINGEEIQLNGIRTPDISQVCRDNVLNLQFGAGGFSLSRLKAKAPPDKAIVCYVESGLRNMGTCFVWGFPGPMNIARLLVREGAAWASPKESSPYIRDEGWAEGAASRDDNPTIKNLWHTDCRRPD